MCDVKKYEKIYEEIAKLDVLKIDRSIHRSISQKKPLDMLILLDLRDFA